jgi:hypothetical protein
MGRRGREEAAGKKRKGGNRWGEVEGRKHLGGRGREEAVGGRGREEASGGKRKEVMEEGLGKRMGKSRR